MRIMEESKLVSGPSKLVVAVYDARVQAFLNPIFCTTKGEAIRSFSDAVADDRAPFKAHPEDYSLFVLGEFDEGLGVFDNTVPAPELLVLAVNLVRKDGA